MAETTLDELNALVSKVEAQNTAITEGNVLIATRIDEAKALIAELRDALKNNIGLNAEAAARVDAVLAAETPVIVVPELDPPAEPPTEPVVE